MKRRHGSVNATPLGKRSHDQTKEPRLSADIVDKVSEEVVKFIRTKRTTNASEHRKCIDARLVEVKRDLEKSEKTLKDFREKKRQVSGSPELLLEQERLVREVQINSTLYVELKKQYELVKIEEIKNIPIINVMDEARPAARKERPKRSTIVLAALFLSFFGGVGYVVVHHRYKDALSELANSLRSKKAEA